MVDGTLGAVVEPTVVPEFNHPSSGSGALYPLLFFVSGWCCPITRLYQSRVQFLHAVEMAFLSRVVAFSDRDRVVGVVECIPADCTR